METRELQQRTVVAGGAQALGDLLRPSRLAREITGDLRDLGEFRHVLRNLVTSQLKVRYQRSVLGFLWTLLHPVLMLTVLALVFSQALGMGIREYSVYLFSGMVPWQFFAACIENGSRSLITQECLIRKVRVQKLIFPLSDVLVAAVNMCFAMGALFLVLQLLRPGVHVQLVLLPVAIALLMIFTFGVTLVSMTLVTRFRDFEHMISVFLQAFYFLCPILYRPDAVGQYKWLLQLNPMTHLLALFQNAFYYGEWGAANWAAAVGSALGMLIIGYLVYKRHENEYIFLL